MPFRGVHSCCWHALMRWSTRHPARLQPSRPVLPLQHQHRVLQPSGLQALLPVCQGCRACGVGRGMGRVRQVEAIVGHPPGNNRRRPGTAGRRHERRPQEEGMHKRCLKRLAALLPLVPNCVPMARPAPTLAQTLKWRRPCMDRQLRAATRPAAIRAIDPPPRLVANRLPAAGAAGRTSPTQQPGQRWAGRRGGSRGAWPQAQPPPWQRGRSLRPGSRARPSALGRASSGLLRLQGLQGRPCTLAAHAGAPGWLP